METCGCVFPLILTVLISFFCPFNISFFSYIDYNVFDKTQSEEVDEVSARVWSDTSPVMQLQQAMAALSIGTVPRSSVNEGVNSSDVFPSGSYVDGITNEGASKVSPSPVEPSSASKSEANFFTRPGSVTSAGVQTLLVRKNVNDVSSVDGSSLSASNACLKNNNSKSLRGSTGVTSNGQQQVESRVAPGLELVVTSAGKSFFLLRFACNMTVALIECYIASTITDHNLAKISAFKLNSTRNEEREMDGFPSILSLNNTGSSDPPELYEMLGGAIDEEIYRVLNKTPNDKHRGHKLIYNIKTRTNRNRYSKCERSEQHCIHNSN
uniref:Uncharacterized protein n=1 Tax=Glossina pallidipes TaxID=7398 RepID=A0A1B0ABV1_GLOPL